MGVSDNAMCTEFRGKDFVREGFLGLALNDNVEADQ